MHEMGKAMMGTGEAEGDGRALEAAEKAIANPLLDGVSMQGAKGVIVSITGGEDMRLMEVDEAANHIRELVDPDANIIWGSAFNENLDGRIRVSVVATGIDNDGVAAAPATASSFAMSTPVATESDAADEDGNEEIEAPASPFMSDLSAEDEPAPIEEPETPSEVIPTPLPAATYDDEGGEDDDGEEEVAAPSFASLAPGMTGEEEPSEDDELVLGDDALEPEPEVAEEQPAAPAGDAPRGSQRWWDAF